MWSLIVIKNYGNFRRMWCAPVWWCNWRRVETSKIQLTKLPNTSKAKVVLFRYKTSGLVITLSARTPLIG